MIQLRFRDKGFLIGCIILTLLILFSGCSSENIYTGRVIEMDFRNIEEIKDQAWVEVNGIRYTHFQHFRKSYQDAYSLPASKEVYYVVKEDSSRTPKYAPVSDFNIAIRLGNAIDLAHTKVDTTLARVKIDQRFLMFTFGRLILQRPDSTEFTVRTSEGYPARITVKSR